MIEARIAFHRHLFRDELDFAPSQRTPPVAFRFDESERAMVPDDRDLVYFTDVGMVQVPDSPTQSTSVGMPMSSRMYRYLAGPSPQTPWAAALAALRAHCRRNHPTHRHRDAPYWRGSLCHQLVTLTVIGLPKGNGPGTVGEAARILRYDAPEPVLREAFDYIEQHIDRSREKAERRAREDEGHGPGPIAAPEHRHHVPSPEHIAECPNPECKARRAA